MCGLVGMAGKLTAAQDKVFKKLLIFDVIRGEHSTGVASVPVNGEVSIAKQVGNPFELFEDKRYDRAINRQNRALIGHNRFATQGAVNKANAHPFQFDHITGAHNGSLTSSRDLEDSKDFVVDSQAIFNHISKKGVVDMVSKVQGAYALVWWDSKKETLNFIRNDERPLFIAFSEKHERLYWASEKWMLEVAVPEHEKIEIEEFPINEWWSFPIKADRIIQKPNVKKVEYVKKPLQTTYYSGYNSYWKGSSKKTTTPAKKAKVYEEIGHQRLGKTYLAEVLGYYQEVGGAPYYEFSVLDSKTSENETFKLYESNLKGEALDEGEVYYISIKSIYYSRGYVYNIDGSSLSEISVDDALEQIAGECLDHKNKIISRDKWIADYGTCSWCTMEIGPEDLEKGATISDSGTALCQGCSESVEVAQYVA